MSHREKPSRRSTIYDVAARAEVSHQTVSRYVKGYTNIDPALQARIQRAIDELNYRPNISARALTLRRSQVVGAIWEESGEFGPTRTMKGVIRRARESGYVVDAFPMECETFGHDTRGRVEEFVRSRDLAGLIVLAPADGLHAAISDASLDLPVLVWGEASEPIAGTQESLAEYGQRLLAEHLAALGHRSVQYISGPLDWISARHRREALESALAVVGIDLEAVHQGDWSSASGYALMSEARLGRSTAVVAANDQVALGAMHALHQRGLHLPDDISVSGFDDIPEAKYFFPALTTVSQHPEVQGVVAMEQLLDLVGDGVGSRRHIPPPELRARSSTAPPRLA